MPILVTGHTGFVGSWLTSQIPGCVFLVDQRGSSVDLNDDEAVDHAVASIDFDAVIHLAAQSFVPDAFSNPAGTYRTNALGTLHLLTALARKKFKRRILFVSTADIYGEVAESDLPIKETQPILPLNPYAVSKVAAEEWCRYFHRVEGLDIVMARPFNHIGPGQSTRFSIADFARSIVEMKLGRREWKLSVGDLNVTRDFTDVRDVIEAYRLLLDFGAPGEVYNVCSGEERHLGTAVQQLLELSGVEAEIDVDPERLRKISQRRVRGDSQTLKTCTGWAPQISWRQSLSDILNNWEEKIR